MKIIQYDVEDFNYDVQDFVENRVNIRKYDSIFGVPRGGIPFAAAIAAKTNLPLVPFPTPDSLVVDDIVDSGKTMSGYPDNDFVAIHCKRHSLIKPTYYIRDIDDEWIEYFWEKNEAPCEDAVIRILEYIGEDPKREGIVETPYRVIKSFKELYSGYNQNPADLLKTFDSDGYNQLVLVKDIELYSMCEHHMLPFIGKAHVGYIPNGKVIGVSKIARLVDLYSRRLQIQERLTDQITSAIEDWLNPAGVACVIEAEHLCMRMRGVAKQNSTMVTSSLKGIFLEDCAKGRAARAEFMGLIK